MGEKRILKIVDMVLDESWIRKIHRFSKEEIIEAYEIEKKRYQELKQELEFYELIIGDVEAKLGIRKNVTGRIVKTREVKTGKLMGVKE